MQSEILKIVVEAFAVEVDETIGTVADTGLDFVDIDDYQWYLPYLKQLVNKVVINGFEKEGKNYFKSSWNITRAESAKRISVMMNL